MTSATPGREPATREDEILVGSEDGVGIASVRSTVRSAIPDDASIVHENDVLDYLAVKLPDARASTKESAIEQLERQPGIAYAEPNYTAYALYEPNDPMFDQQYAPQLVNAPEAWDTTMGSMDVTIAIADTGVQYDHADIEARFQGSEGRDFVDNDSDPYPANSSESHGTHVAGCAASTTDDGTGCAGIANCHLISARVLGADGSGSYSSIADGIQWSADQGADIINMSLGGPSGSTTLRNAINYAYNNDSLPIAAAGNSGNQPGAPVGYPAKYDNCMAVSAIDSNENLAGFSSYGPSVNVCSPGADVLSSVPWDSHASYNGTSMACPVASGVAALGKSAHPDLSAQELWDHLEETAVDIGLPSDQQGAGRVDAANIVEGGGGGECGGETDSTSEQGFLAWWNTGDVYTYGTTTSSPCAIDIALDGPGSFADYDLYVTYDGREPTPTDYDDRSAGSGDTESISSSLSGSTNVGILVHANRGWGSYDLTINEQGQ